MHSGFVSAEIAAGMLAFKSQIEATKVKQRLSTLHQRIQIRVEATM
ncbi:MAG: hypothetical protein ACM3NN_07705 [Nitrospirota bacterium]|jgi:hypothetical protein